MLMAHYKTQPHSSSLAGLNLKILNLLFPHPVLCSEHSETHFDA